MRFFKKSATRSLMPTIFSGNPTPPIRHPSESWDPVSLTFCKSLDPSFRWDDEHLAIPATRAVTFSGQQWAFAGKTILSFLQYPNKWRLS
jgi:hypothetical protein